MKPPMSFSLAVAMVSLAFVFGPILPSANAADCKGTTTIEMSECGQNDFREADAELNEVYQKLRATLDETGKTVLRDAQRAWITYRDAECLRIVDPARGGSMVSIIYPGCRARMTQERIKELRVNPLTGEPAF